MPSPYRLLGPDEHTEVGSHTSGEGDWSHDPARHTNTDSPPDPLVTVVTATWNRAHLLGRLHDSLKGQTMKSFEWLVVDDGSTDDTLAYLLEWANTSPVAIRGLRQDHRGKHVALNRAVAEARGRYVAVIDSDDWYLPRSLERMLYHFDAIPSCKRDCFANVEGRTVLPNGTPVGDSLPQEVLE